jgi:hypothetical protein
MWGVSRCALQGNGVLHDEKYPKQVQQQGGLKSIPAADKTEGVIALTHTGERVERMNQ